MPGKDSPLLVDVRDGVAWFTLNRPTRLNALNGEMMFGLVDHLTAAMADPQVRVLVITGVGRAFCAGGDVNGLDEVIGNGPLDEQARRLRGVTRITEILHDGSKPVLAALNGACAGAGLSIAAAADIRVTVPEAIFTTAFVAIGVSGDLGGTWNLARIVGPARAKRLYLECERVDARTALDMGLVDAIVAPDELATEVQRRALRLASFSAPALGAVRANFRDIATHDFASFLDRESQRQVQTQATPESQRAIQAFIAARST